MLGQGTRLRAHSFSNTFASKTSGCRTCAGFGPVVCVAHEHVSLPAMNFAAYAESLPGTVLDQLYQSLHVCQAILHSLPPLAKQYVVRMLHAEQVPSGERMVSTCQD